ncbi:hypothetical protein BCT07_09685 [Vibrio breoganii]|uniref:glycosyltransferase n=1 Tax=Vibrio breoganii TaxID=553239 RepID=UPI000C81F27F|nr:glycosyltransferase [Vibrio breoganii]PMO59272.1 hypothetical protein BCT07_09685 [Vibrio breoganii]
MYKKEEYDLIFITNVPSFYKVNLYNEISKKKKIKVIFISQNSIVRNDDFVKDDFHFDYVILNKGNYQNRSKFKSFFMLVHHLVSSKYKYLIYPGWEFLELFLLSFMLSKQKNALIIESSIYETVTTGYKWFFKRIYLGNMSLAFPSGKLQRDILELAKFKGEINYTHGVGLFNFKKEIEIQVAKRKPQELKFLYVGRLSPEKNLELLVDVFNVLGLNLTIIGDGPSMSKLVGKSNENIKYKGYVDNLLLEKIYTEHDVFILPSISEPWGLVVEEALAKGLPVIVSNKVGCLSDLVTNYESGTVFMFNEQKSLIKAIEKMIFNYSYYKGNVQKIDFNKRNEAQVMCYLSI